MTMANSRKATEKTSQQWAWEFLRRNPTYRDAFGKLAVLTPEALWHLETAGEATAESVDVDVDVVRDLDIHFFDTSGMVGFKPEQKTVGDYMDQTQRLREAMQEPLLELTVARKFTLETYSLAGWYNPAAELSAEDFDEMWFHQTIVDTGLERASWADERRSFLEVMDETEHLGWPSRPPKQKVVEKVDRRRRGAPKLEMHAMQGALRGADRRVFVRHKTVEHVLGATHASAVFDMSLPVDFQLARVTEFLKQHQKDLAKSSIISAPTVHADRFGNYSQYLQILDMLDAGMSHLDIAKELDGVRSINEWRRDPKANQLVKVQKVVGRSKPGASVNELTQSVRKKIERALSLRDHGYRALAFNF